MPKTENKTTTKKPEDIDKEELSKIIDVDTEIVKINFDESAGETKISDEVRILVKSLVFGRLYVKLKDGSTYEFSRPGETQEITIRELRELKATQQSFFSKQQLLILGVSPANPTECKATPADVYKCLGVDKFFRNYIDPTSFREVCFLNLDEIEMRAKLIAAQPKENLIIALRNYVEKGVLTDLKRIDCWEKNLGCELMKKR